MNDKNTSPAISPFKKSELRFARPTGLKTPYTPLSSSASADSTQNGDGVGGAKLSPKKSMEPDTAEKPFSFFSSLSGKGTSLAEKAGEKDPSSQRRAGSIFSTPTNRSFSINPVLSSTMNTTQNTSPGPDSKPNLSSESSERDGHSPLSTIKATTSTPTQPSPASAVKTISRAAAADSIGNTVNPLRSAKAKPVGTSAASSPAVNPIPSPRPRPPAGNSALAAEIVKNLQKARNTKGGPGGGGGRLAGGIRGLEGRGLG